MEKILQGEIGVEINLNSFQNGDSFLINSFGGSLFEGLAIYDYIHGNNIEVGVIGVCASAATLPVIASANSWGTPNSRFLIHNPSALGAGTSTDIQKTADELMAEQQRAVDLYAKHLTVSREEIQAIMNEERWLSADEALQLGLIKQIKEFSKTESVKPDADLKLLYNQFKMKIEMSEHASKEDVSKLELLIQSVKDSIATMFKPAPKMIVLTATTGEALDFGEILTEEEIAVGVKATINGVPAEGSYVMPDGKTFVFVGGELTEIVEPVDDEQLKAENEELKAQNQELQNNVETMKAELEQKTQMLATLNGTVEKLETEFKTFKNKFSSNKLPINTPPVEQSNKKFTFKKK